MRLTDSNIEALESTLRHLHMSGELKPEDHNWYIVANELVKVYKDGQSAVRRLQEAKEEIQYAEKTMENIRQKEGHVYNLFEKLHQEREARENAKSSGK